MSSAVAWGLIAAMLVRGAEKTARLRGGPWGIRITSLREGDLVACDISEDDVTVDEFSVEHVEAEWV